MKHQLHDLGTFILSSGAMQCNAMQLVGSVRIMQHFGAPFPKIILDSEDVEAATLGNC